MIISDVLLRVFRVQYAGQQGTMFTVEQDGRQYLVSAKHIFECAQGNFEIELYHDNTWKPIRVTLTGHSNSSDISVFAANQVLTTPELVAEASCADIYYGQDVYFLGFPYGLFGDFPEVNVGYPMPFVKKAILSMMSTKADNAMYLDGINNIGFSGGPVAFVVNGNIKHWRIAGVISGYVSAPEVVSDQGRDVGLRYSANTGLIKASPINDAVSLISDNPNGFLMPLKPS